MPYFVYYKGTLARVFSNATEMRQWLDANNLKIVENACKYNIVFTEDKQCEKYVQPVEEL